MRKLTTILLCSMMLVSLSAITSETTYALSMYAGLLDDPVSEYRTRYEFESGGNVSITGSHGVSSDGEAMWIFAANVVTITLSPIELLCGEDIYTQFWHSNGNDGIAHFETMLVGSGTWVDHGSLETWKGGNQYALIDGLDPGKYHLKITSMTGQHGDDLHLGHYGATRAVIPEPTTMVLLGIGLVGLVAIRRKKRG